MDHQIEAWPEGRPHCWLASNSSINRFLDAWFAENDAMHAMHNVLVGAFMLGADWNRGNFNQFTREGDDGEDVWQWAIICVGCDEVWAEHRLVRVERRKQYLFDIGPVTDDDILAVEPPRVSPFAEFHDLEAQS
jgi:hypothetical protein